MESLKKTTILTITYKEGEYVLRLETWEKNSDSGVSRRIYPGNWCLTGRGGTDVSVDEAKRTEGKSRKDIFVETAKEKLSEVSNPGTLSDLLSDNQQLLELAFYILGKDSTMEIFPGVRLDRLVSVYQMSAGMKLEKQLQEIDKVLEQHDIAPRKNDGSFLLRFNNLEHAPAGFLVKEHVCRKFHLSGKGLQLKQNEYEKSLVFQYMDTKKELPPLQIEWNLLEENVRHSYRVFPDEHTFQYETYFLWGKDILINQEILAGRENFPYEIFVCFMDGEKRRFPVVEILLKKLQKQIRDGMRIREKAKGWETCPFLILTPAAAVDENMNLVFHFSVKNPMRMYTAGVGENAEQDWEFIISLIPEEYM